MFYPWNHPNIMSAKEISCWVKKMAVFDDIQYCIHEKIMGHGNGGSCRISRSKPFLMKVQVSGFSRLAANANFLSQKLSNIVTPKPIQHFTVLYRVSQRKLGFFK